MHAHRQDPPPTTSALRRFHARADAPHRLILLPHAGGAASYYRQWRHDELDVQIMQYPGREDRLLDPMPTHLLALAMHTAETIETSLQKDPRPFALLGHSMGALVAFEAARHLQCRGHTPALLVFSAHEAPGSIPPTRLHLQPDQALLDELERLAGTRPALFDLPELLAMALPILRSDYRLIETYQVSTCADIEPLHCPLLLCSGDNDPDSNIGVMRAWQAYTRRSTSELVLPGGHFYLNHHSASILAKVSQLMAAATTTSPPLSPVLDKKSWGDAAV